MNWLIGFERSGRIRSRLRALGHDAWSCDLQPADDMSEYHMQCDIREVIGMEWDAAVLHPECTFVTNSGARWLYSEPLRWQKMIEGAVMFRDMLNAPIPRIAVENPVMHKWAVKIVGRKHDQLVQPWMFGHPETKATCFWLKNLPPLRPTRIVDGRHGRVWRMAPSPERAYLRAITYEGVADAIADQWGSLEPIQAVA